MRRGWHISGIDHCCRKNGSAENRVPWRHGNSDSDKHKPNNLDKSGRNTVSEWDFSVVPTLKYLEKNQYSLDEYECVEFKTCEPYYMRESVQHSNLTISGTSQLSFNTDSGMQNIYDDEGNGLYATNGCLIEVPAYEQHFVLSLIDGSAQYHKSYPTEEGYHYESECIELIYDDNGFPVWEISRDSGGRDCDGPIERHSFYLSYGGFANSEHYDNKERYEQQYKYHSELISHNYRKGYIRDYYAEAMGY